MLEVYITAKTYLKILLKFLLCQVEYDCSRTLQSEFNDLSYIIGKKLGHQSVYQANSKHSMYPEIHDIITNHYGLYQVIENTVNKVGRRSNVWGGEITQGNNRRTIDLCFGGNKLDKIFF